MKDIILQYSLATIFSLYIIVWSCYRLFYKRTFLPSPKQDEKNKVDPMVVEWRNKHRIAFEIFYITLIGAILIFTFFCGTIPFCKDLPYILTDEYLYFNGEIVNEYQGSRRWGNRTLMVIESNDKTLTLSIQAESVKKGDYVEVKYLPNTETGVVMSYSKGGASH